MARAKCLKAVCDVDGKASLNFNDFGVAVPSDLGITVTERHRERSLPSRAGVVGVSRAGVEPARLVGTAV